VYVFLATVSIPFLGGWDFPFMSHRQRGDRDFQAERYSEAIDHFKKAIDREGNDWRLLYNLGTSYYHTGEYDKAIEELSYAAQIAETERVPETDRAHVLHNLGLSYLQNGDCESAVPTLKSATELDPSDENIAKNASFAESYCSESAQQAPQTEGEEKNQGSGNQQDENQGQASQGQSNSQDQAQNNAGQGQDPQQNSGGQGQNEQTPNQGGGQDQGTQQQPGQDQQPDQQPEEGGNKPEETDVAGRNEGSSGGSDEEQNSDQGGGSGNASEGGSDLSRGGSPSDVPPDGLPFSDAQIEELLRNMSRLERNNAPRYFQNTPAEGDYLDNESMIDLLRRLFLGLPTEDRKLEAEDGIDW
jgi:hypothetical protein